MSTTEFSSNPAVRRWFHKILSEVAAQAGILNLRGQVSVSNMVASIAFAYRVDPAQTIALVQEIYKLGEKERRAHKRRTDARKGSKKTESEFPSLPNE